MNDLLNTRDSKGCKKSQSVNENKPKRVVGYIRVSTLKQVQEGHSLNFQKEAIEKYCKLQNLILIKPLFIDEGLSAIKERPKFTAMLNKALTDDTVDGIIVNDLTRFGRTTEELLTQIKHLDSKHKVFISIKEQFDISTKIGRFVLGSLSLFADFERETTIERMQAGKDYAKIHGTKHGKPMHRPPKEIDFELVRMLRKSNTSWNQIAKKVNVTTPTIITRAAKEGIQ